MTFPQNPLSITTGLELTDEELRQIILRTEIAHLSAELTDFNKYRDYYEGIQKLSFGTERFKAKFGLAFQGFVDNWCKVVVDATADRLEVLGISDIAGQEETLDQIWQVMLRNDLDEQQAEIHEGALVEGKSFVIVWPDPDENLRVRLDWNSAQLVRVRYSDEDWRRPVFAVKRWMTPSGQVYANLYTPSFVYKYMTAKETPRSGRSGVAATIPAGGPSYTLNPREVPGESWPLRNPFGEIPVVEFNNKNGSELRDVIPQQDAINYLLLTSFTAAEFAAFGQRGFFGGVTAPEGGWDNSPGTVWEVRPAFDADQRAIPQSAFTFPPAELNGFIGEIEMMLQHMALTSKTPVRMFHKSDRGGRGDAPSGDSLIVEDEPLIDKIENRQARFGNSWYRVVRLVAKTLGIESPLPPGEMRWKDPRAKYRTSLVEEGAKMVKMGIPLRFVIKTLGFSPEQIAELETLLAEQEQKAEAEKQAALDAQVAAAEAQPTPTVPSESD